MLEDLFLLSSSLTIVFPSRFSPLLPIGPPYLPTVFLSCQVVWVSCLGYLAQLSCLDAVRPHMVLLPLSCLFVTFHILSFLSRLKLPMRLRVFRPFALVSVRRYYVSLVCSIALSPFG
jgi:hypothetical protein